MKNKGMPADNKLFLEAVYRAIDKKIAHSRKEQDNQINTAKKVVDNFKSDSNEVDKSNALEESNSSILEFYRMGTFRSVPNLFTIDKKDDTDDKNSYIDNSDNNKVYAKTLHL